MDKSYKELGYKKPEDLNPWEKAYWYMRVLVDSNRFGNLAKNTRKLERLHTNLLSTYTRVVSQNDSVADKLSILDSMLQQTLLEGLESDTTVFSSMAGLYDRLKKFLIEPKDYAVLALTVSELLMPASEAVKRVPSTEVTDYARKYARAVLDTKGEQGLDTLIREWDSFTEDLSLNKERDIIVDLFENIRTSFGQKVLSLGSEISDREMAIVLSAVTQEYERRVGQKRKSRAGQDLESATDFIFKYFGLKTHGKPEHFVASMEVDNWLKCNDGWFLGISLKRTLRERWKQTLTTEIGLYDQYKIKHIIHIVNNDFDLSDNKVTEMGRYRHLFCLADNSDVLRRFQSHVALSKYVFPVSQLITKVKSLL